MRRHEFQRVGQVGRKRSHAALPVSDTVAPAAPIPYVVGGREDRRLRVLVGLAVILLLTAGGLAALPGLASGAPFQRGDVLVTNASGINEYSPSGQLQQTLPGVDFVCIDPSGKYLIDPGVGMFDSSGNALPSNWAGVPQGGRHSCVVDGFGRVYVAGGANDTLLAYDLRGNLLHTYYPAIATTVLEPGVWTVDIAPDECTIYYWIGYGFEGGIYRFNVCTNTQEPYFTSGGSYPVFFHVLPNWQVLIGSYQRAFLVDASGNRIRSYYFPSNQCTIEATPDPDGTSLWMGWDCGNPMFSGQALGRLDITSGQLLTEWQPSNGTGYDGSLAVYGPPLLGNANVESTVDSDTAGTAEAFVTRARYSGQMSRLHLYIDSSSTASQVVVGVYSNNNGHPGALLERGTITNVMPGSWNYVDVPSMPVTAGQRYWIAVLGPKGGGTISFRDAVSGAGSETSAQHKLTALPAKWSTGNVYADGHLSAYGS